MLRGRDIEVVLLYWYSLTSIRSIEEGASNARDRPSNEFTSTSIRLKAKLVRQEAGSCAELECESARYQHRWGDGC